MRMSIGVRALPALAFASTLCLASTAGATVVNEWSYSVQSSFTGASDSNGNTGPFGTGFVFSDSQIAWGDPAGAIGVGGGRSALTIGDSPLTGNVFTNGAAVAANSLTHSNNRILLRFPQLDKATMQVEVALSSLDPSVGNPDPFTLSFEIDFLETDNNPDNPGPDRCADGAIEGRNGPGCRDIFVISMGSLTTMFDFQGETYTFSFFDLDGALGPLADNACAAVGQAPGCLGFLTREEQENIVNFGFRISRIPEPAMLGLFGLGLAGIAAGRRRRRA